MTIHRLPVDYRFQRRAVETSQLSLLDEEVVTDKWPMPQARNLLVFGEDAVCEEFSAAPLLFVVLVAAVGLVWGMV